VFLYFGRRDVQVDADSQLRVRQLDDRLTEEIRDRFDRVASRAASLAAEVSHASAASAAASAAASSAASAAETSAADAASAAAAALTAADAASAATAALTAASAATPSVDVATPPTPTGDALSREQIEGIVRDALATYDADKTGVADYALEPAGGSVRPYRVFLTEFLTVWSTRPSFDRFAVRFIIQTQTRIFS